MLFFGKNKRFCNGQEKSVTKVPEKHRFIKKHYSSDF